MISNGPFVPQPPILPKYGLSITWNRSKPKPNGIRCPTLWEKNVFHNKCQLIPWTGYCNLHDYLRNRNHMLQVLALDQLTSASVMFHTICWATREVFFLTIHLILKNYQSCYFTLKLPLLLSLRFGLHYKRFITNQLFSVHVNLVIINDSYLEYYLVLVRDTAKVKLKY